MARPKDPSLRTRLLVAAAGEFSEHGFAGASMTAIGSRAGVTKGGVYFHFRSKEELFFAVIDEWNSGLRSVLRHREPSADGADQVRACIAAFLDFHFRHPETAGLLRVVATEMQDHFTAQVREDLGSALRALRARMRELLAIGSRDGTVFTTDPAQAAFLLAAGVEGVIQQWLASSREVAPFCHAESLADALVAPYATGGGTQPEPSPEASHGGDLSPPF